MKKETIKNDKTNKDSTQLQDKYDVAVFDSLDDSNADVIYGCIPWNEAIKNALILWQSQKYFGVEIIDTNPNNIEPIVWVKSKFKKNN